MSPARPAGAVFPQPAHMLCRVEGVSDRFGLTFDDGPSPRHSPVLLERLAAHGARATFFQLGRRVRRHPDLTRRARDEGHEVAVHDDLHLPPLLLPAALRRREFERALATFAAVGVEPAPFYRPPFGLMTVAHAVSVRARGFTPVLGDVFPHDPHRPGVRVIVERTLEVLRAGSILILHEGSGWGDFDRMQTLDAVVQILDAARARGLGAVPVGELLAAR